MCIAIYKPKGITLHDFVIENSWNNNPDGGGFMYVEGNKLNIVKGLMTLAAFKEAFEPHKKKLAVLHFRIATHGNTDEQNTHPFAVDNNLGVVHNGIISKVDTSTDKTKSDTWHFVDAFLKAFREVNKSFWLKKQFKVLIEEYIGASKLIFLDSKGNVDIYNESMGTWNSNCWFSNTSFQTNRSTFSRRNKNLPITHSGFDDDYYYNNQSPPQPVSTRTEGMGIIKKLNNLSDLKLGDFCKTDVDLPVHLHGDQTIPKGTKVRITSNFNQASVWIIDDISKKEACCALWKLAVLTSEETTYEEIEAVFPGDNVVFIANHNHFRIGEVAKVNLITPNSIVVEDNTTNKFYTVPKMKLKPEAALIVPSTQSLH